ncbi:hypothetical protein R70199_07593 [Paraburkholderia domus]|nr:hypothetical protein R70199_07593 [Paraburkholderia domus]
MSASSYARVQALRGALEEEVHGLWISDEMAVKILARLDMVTAVASKPNTGESDSSCRQAAARSV